MPANRHSHTYTHRSFCLPESVLNQFLSHTYASSLLQLPFWLLVLFWGLAVTEPAALLVLVTCTGRQGHLLAVSARCALLKGKSGEFSWNTWPLSKTKLLWIKQNASYKLLSSSLQTAKDDLLDLLKELKSLLTWSGATATDCSVVLGAHQPCCSVVLNCTFCNSLSFC